MKYDEDKYYEARLAMVENQIARRGVKDENVLDAMRTVPRHFFVDPAQRASAYFDGPLAIGHGQTISQPYVVASMTEELHLKPSSKVLEIGTGCGYQTAVLAEIAKEVYSIEYVKELHDQAARLLSQLGYTNIVSKHGDGSLGWPEYAPFDGIIVTAAAPQIPQPLLDQLADDGRMVIPLEIGFGRQDLVVVTREGDNYRQRTLYPVRFVSMRGEVEET